MTVLSNMTLAEAEEKLNDRLAFVTEVTDKGFTLVVDGERYEIDTWAFWRED